MKRYDKSQIMRRAHYIREHAFCSMSEALKQSWKEAKRQAEISERFGSRDLKATGYDRRNAREFRNVRFGRNDWAFLYGRKYNW